MAWRNGGVMRRQSAESVKASMATGVTAKAGKPKAATMATPRRRQRGSAKAASESGGMTEEMAAA